MSYGPTRIDNMINKFLNKKIFEKDCEQVPIRHGFGEGLVIAGEKDKNVVVLCADLTESAQAIFFKEKFPERFIEIGVAEQNLAGVASGISATGKIPFITSYAMFSPGRNWEQIRTTIAYNNRPVKIAGSHTGVSVGPDGGTHQALEDIAIMRTMPRMVVISPCDAIEARKATIESAKTNTPVYIRLAREKTPVMTTEDTLFEIGKAQIFYEPNPSDGQDPKPEVAIIATGALVHKAMQVAKKLESEIGVIVVNLATIKPLDKETILDVAKRAEAVVTVEEHQIMGGMGSAVAELLAQENPVPIEFVGVNDEFGQSGTPDELIEHYGLGVEGIEKAVRKVLKRKNV